MLTPELFACFTATPFELGGRVGRSNARQILNTGTGHLQEVEGVEYQRCPDEPDHLGRVLKTIPLQQHFGILSLAALLFSGFGLQRRPLVHHNRNGSSGGRGRRLQ